MAPSSTGESECRPPRRDVSLPWRAHRCGPASPSREPAPQRCSGRKRRERRLQSTRSRTPRESAEREMAHFQTEAGVLLKELARRAAERARVRTASLGELEREIEEASVLRRSKPPAGFAARCSKIQQDPLRVVTGIFSGDCPERRDAS